MIDLEGHLVTKFTWWWKCKFATILLWKFSGQIYAIWPLRELSLG